MDAVVVAVAHDEFNGLSMDKLNGLFCAVTRVVRLPKYCISENFYIIILLGITWGQAPSYWGVSMSRVTQLLKVTLVLYLSLYIFFTREVMK